MASHLLDDGDQKPRELLIRRSLIRPILLAGGDRELTIINWFASAALVMGIGFSWKTIILAAVMLTFGQVAIVQATKHDPQFRKVYLRHIRHQTYYPARSSVHSAPGPVYPSIPA